MGGAETGTAGAVEPQQLVFRLRWSEIQRLNRARQTSGSRWATDARWRIFPLMLVLFGVYSLFSFGFGSAWLLGMLGLTLAAGVFLAFPGVFRAWARLPVLHWTIFDPVNLLLRRTVDVDGDGVSIHGWRGESRIAWTEIEECEGSTNGITLHQGLRAWYLPGRAFDTRANFDTYAALAARHADGEAMVRR